MWKLQYLKRINSIYSHFLYRSFLYSKNLSVFSYSVCDSILTNTVNDCVETLHTCHIYVRLRSTSNPQIHVRFLHHRHLYLRCPFLKFSNRHPILIYTSFFKFSNQRPILKSMAVSHFLKTTSNDVCPNS
jgi:hypothetical protein